MRNYKKILALSLCTTALFTTGCKDDFATVNTNPSAVTEGNPSYLFAKGILDFEPQGYLYWFYSAPSIYQWIQTGVSTGSVTSSLSEGAEARTLNVIDVLKYVNEIAYVRSTMPEEESAKYAQYAAALDVLAIYMGLYDSDFVGYIPYTEAAKASHGGSLTPKYDKVEDLYSLWLENLDKAISTFTSATDQVFIASQDPIYAGDVSKWAKLANSVKLKLAARLLSQDKTRALAIASEVGKSATGVLNGAGDDFLFSKAQSAANTNNNDFVYHWNQTVLSGVAGSESVIDFMVKNRDPRVRFIFKKNSWNSKIVQLFFDADRANDVPKYIMDNLEYTIDASGKYKFVKWTGAGEPWVRYYGLPLDYEASNNTAEFGDWFDVNQYKYNDQYSYTPFSMFQTEMLHGRNTFTLPTTPSDPAIRDEAQVPWWGMYMTTAEVNLYLAEFAILGADLPQDASTYFNKALKASVEEYDLLAQKNKIPYYGTTYNYDPFEKVIDLQAGEIDVMLANEDYQLTGDPKEDLEKIYIQQILHFYLQPGDQFVTARRSGIPMIGSSLINRETYSQVPTSIIPRRMSLTEPSPTDLMHDILKAAYEEQGLSVGTGTILNSERLWQDKGAPQWGEGPKF